MIASLVVAALTTAAQPMRCPQSKALFADIRSHTGGSGWESARELIASGTATAFGLTGNTRIAIDRISGATSTIDQGAIGTQQTVVTPAVTWRKDFTQGVHPLNAPDALASARTAAYLARNAYFAGDGGGASFGCPAATADGSRTLERIEVRPPGGRPVTVWVDPALHAIVRTQEQAPTDVTIVDYADFRNTQGLLVPYTITDRDSRPADTIVRLIQTYRIEPSVNVADFARPPDPMNQHFLNGATSTQLDVDVTSGSPVVNASVNGGPPLPFILDTGGHAILTADAAKQLGIAGMGSGVSGGGGESTIPLQFGRVQSLRIGDAEITDLPVLIIPYGKTFPYAGILGVEIFERFAVTIDYLRHTLRVQTQPYAPAPGENSVDLLFEDDMPLAYASADGTRGLFGIDTGNSGRTILIGDFLRNHGFFARYTNGLPAQSSGTGGAVQQTLYRLRELAFGGLTLHNFVTGFVVQQTGSFGSRTQAGNLGHDVLSQFTVTTDYPRGRMYLRPESDAPVPVFSRVGIGLTRDPQGGLSVTSVTPNSPAADAGIEVGDAVLTVDGTPAGDIPTQRFNALFRQPLGTALHLSVRRSTGVRDVTIVLREQLCNPGQQTCTPYVTHTP